MTDVDDLLATDANRWRAGQGPVPDLDAAVKEIVRPTSPGVRRTTVLLVAAAVLLVGGVGAAVVGPGTRHVTPAASSSAPAPSSSSPVSPRVADLPRLPPPEDGRKLLTESGRADARYPVAGASGRGELIAVCLGGGRISIAMPGAGGFDLDCTGTPSAASLPRLGTAVTVRKVRGQVWRLAVFDT